jgi:hypothetical protein
MRKLYVLIAAAAVVLVHANPAEAKGRSYLVGATLSAGGIVAPIDALFSAGPQYAATEEYLDVPLYQNDAESDSEFLPRTSAMILKGSLDWQPHEPSPAAVPFAVVVHYDFERYGGKRNWTGWYDGKDVLYIPEAMIVGPGGWAAGWYRVSPKLADSLSKAGRWGKLDPSLRQFRPQSAAHELTRVGLLLTLAFAGSAALYLRGAKPGNTSLAQIQERMAQRELQLGLGARP